MNEIDIPKSTLMQSKCPSMMTVEVRIELYYIICTTGYRVYTCRGQVLSNFSTDSCFCALGTLMYRDTIWQYALVCHFPGLLQEMAMSSDYHHTCIMIMYPSVQA